MCIFYSKNELLRSVMTSIGSKLGHKGAREGEADNDNDNLFRPFRLFSMQRSMHYKGFSVADLWEASGGRGAKN